MQALEWQAMSRPPVSVIIPCYNGTPRLAECLTALVEGMSAGVVREVIVVDGASGDQSAALAEDMGCRVETIDPSTRGRGNQLRHGAHLAVGEWLLFVHADSVVQEGWAKSVAIHCASQAPFKAAYFQLKFDQVSGAAQRVASLANLRARLLGLPYGDAGLLISRALYKEVGGFQALPFMEDVDLVRRIGKSRLLQLNARIETSAKKFERGGWWFVPIRNLFLTGAYFLGFKPETLARMYR